MADVDQNVMSFVEQVLTQDPEIRLEDLFERARKAHPSVRELSRRQFNARYPLQVKRVRAQSEKAEGRGEKGGGRRTAARRKSRKTRTADAARDAVRQVFLEFATDITGAEERKDLVKVLANVDRYVDQVLKGVAG